MPPRRSPSSSWTPPPLHAPAASAALPCPTSLFRWSPALTLKSRRCPTSAVRWTPRRSQSSSSGLLKARVLLRKKLPATTGIGPSSHQSKHRCHKLVARIPLMPSFAPVLPKRAWNLRLPPRLPHSSAACTLTLPACHPRLLKLPRSSRIQLQTPRGWLPNCWAPNTTANAGAAGGSIRHATATATGTASTRRAACGRIGIMSSTH